MTFFLYKNIEDWEGMKFCTKNLRGSAIKFKDIIATQEKAVEILDNFWSNLVHNKHPVFECIDATYS